MRDLIVPQTDDFDASITLSFPSSRSQALDMCVNSFLENNTIDAYSDPKDITEQVISLTQNEFRRHNETAPEGTKMSVPTDLTPAMIAKIMLRMYSIKNINCAGKGTDESYDILGIYQEDGPDKGIYISREKEIEKKISEFNPELTEVQIKQTMNILRIEADRVERCSDPDLIAVNNGIFNYKTKILEPFDSEKVFTAKCRVDYNPVASNITIHNPKDNTDWNVEDWIKELFDDDDIAECIWQIMGAIIRPNVRWNKAAWFVSEKGNNGKGTLCVLMRNLAGERTCAAIPLSDFGKDFMLEPLIHASSIITDENDVGTFIDKAANLKAIITNDVIQINRKFKTPIAYQFKGFMVQCVNEMPRTKDKSESFYRRQIFIPFTKCYTGIERKYIKNDYLNRKDVLEYVLYKILNMNYYEIKVPESCEKALEKYKTYNDPVRDFLLEVTSEACWDCFPSTLLFDMYKNWFKKNNPNGTVQGRNTFIEDVKKAVGAVSGWYYVDPKSPKRVSRRMDCDEPLLDGYKCEDWMYNPKTEDGRVKIKKKIERTGGIFRDACTAGINPGKDDDTDNSDSDSDESNK